MRAEQDNNLLLSHLNLKMYIKETLENVLNVDITLPLIHYNALIVD